MAGLPAVGHKVSYTRIVTDEDVVAFARVTGDDQALHLDPDFGKRIAHGMLSAGYISAVLGTRLWPDGTVIYMSQNLQFRRPVSIGDKITAEAEVTAVDAEKRIVTVRTDCVNQDGETVVRGEATVMIDELR